MGNRNMQRLRRAYLKQKRTAVQEAFLKQLNSEAQARSKSGQHLKRINDMFGIDVVTQRLHGDAFGVHVFETNSAYNRWRRTILGLNINGVGPLTSREEVLARLRSVVDKSICLHSDKTTRTFLVYEKGDYWYFL